VEAERPMKIVIDPGHGGKDPGATSKGILEKEIALQAGKLLKTHLSLRGAEVTLTREEDTYLTLRGRSKKALEEEAELFISIHVNAAGPKARGWEVWYHNELDPDYMIAKKIAQGLRRQNIIKEHGRNPRSDYRRYRSGFGVLRGLKRKARGVLIELGFLTNSQDRRILCNPLELAKLLKRIASSIIPEKVPERLIPVIFEGKTVGRARVEEGVSYLATPLRNFLEGLEFKVIWTGRGIKLERREEE